MDRGAGSRRGQGTFRPRLEALEARLALHAGHDHGVHFHAHLQILVAGQPVAVPAHLGVTPAGHQAVHTRDASGTIHVESAESRTFYLQELFDAWGQPLTPAVFLGIPVQPQYTLTMTVNGVPTAALGGWVLHANDAIVLSLDPRPVPPPVAFQLAHSTEYSLQLVTTFYEDYLGRPPDEAGLAYWSGQLRQGMRAEQIEGQILGSAEYRSLHGDGDAWLDAVYQELLERDADAGGLAYWGNQLAVGSAPADVATAVAASRERWGLLVEDLYAGLLGREADAGGWDYWVGQLLNGLRRQDLEASFVDSAEYYHHPDAGGGDPGQYVRSAYDDLLHRPASDAETDHWAAQLDPAWLEARAVG